MARTKTTSSNPEIHTSPRARPHPPQPNAVDDQPSDHSPLNKTPVHTVLPDEIIPLFEPSKPKYSKKPITKPKPKATRRSNRMKFGSSSKTSIAHINLCSNEEAEGSE